MEPGRLDRLGRAPLAGSGVQCTQQLDSSLLTADRPARPRICADTGIVVTRTHDSIVRQ